MVIESNSFVGLGSGAVQFDYMDTEGLCARSAVVRNNVVTDVSQLASHGTSPACAPRAAFWTDGPYSMAEERLWRNDAQRFNGVHQPQRKQPAPVGGLPLHQDLLYANRVSPMIPLHIYIFLKKKNMLISICIISRAFDSDFIQRYQNNTINSGPHASFQFYRAHNVLVEGNHVTRCSNHDVVAWGYVVNEGGDASIVSIRCVCVC